MQHIVQRGIAERAECAGVGAAPRDVEADTAEEAARTAAPAAGSPCSSRYLPRAVAVRPAA
jgi:hypothetical protein